MMVKCSSSTSSSRRVARIAFLPLFAALLLFGAGPTEAGLRGAMLPRAALEAKQPEVALEQDEEELGKAVARDQEAAAEEEKGEGGESESGDEEDEHDDHEHTEEEDEERRRELASQRVALAGRKADVDGDQRLSAQELRSFANAAQTRQRSAVASEVLQRKDLDKDGRISFAEAVNQIAEAEGANAAGGSSQMHTYALAKFSAADADRDGNLVLEELVQFLHPDLAPELLEVETNFQIGWMDKNGNGVVDLAEFAPESGGRAQEDADFSYEDAVADFHMHDKDKSGGLDKWEVQDLLKGHVLMDHHIEKAIQSADDDNDGYIHVHRELPVHLEEFLDNEYVEDYFIQPHHDEL